jgi:hypothetical protein
MRGAEELRTRMLRVWQGDETDQTTYLPGADITRARFSLLTGGARWRLTLRTRDQRLTLRGFGDGRVQEDQVAGLLRDRLTTTWLHSRPEVLAVRNAIGRAGMLLGALALAGALVLNVVTPPGWPAEAPPVLALCGAVALGLAVLPDLVMHLVWKARGLPQRPVPTVVTRRYARSSFHIPEPASEASEIAVGPTGQASAMDAITLDLGDLPDLPDWPDEVVDLGDLPDLPDWPPEMAKR